MKKIFCIKQKGLTLIELIIGLALSSVVMAAVGTFLVTNINFFNIAQDEIYIQNQVRKSMRAVTNLVMEKENIMSLLRVGNNTTRAIFTESSEENEKELTFDYNPDLMELKYSHDTIFASTIAKNISQFLIETIEKDKYNSKLIEVTIEGVKNPGNKKKEVKFTLTNKIFLRN